MPFSENISIRGSRESIGYFYSFMKRAVLPGF